MIYSPLRYPGGKGKLAPFMKVLIEKTGHKGGTYIEPFAKAGADYFTFHLEAAEDPQKLIDEVKKAGMKCGKIVFF